MALYRDFVAREDQDPDALNRARELFLALERGDPDLVASWKQFRQWSLTAFAVVYQRLRVDFDRLWQSASPCEAPAMPARRIMPYHETTDPAATRAFYTGVLGLEEGDFGGGYIGFGSGPAQVLFAPPAAEAVRPDMGVDVGSREAVDGAYAEAVRAGHEVVYGPVDEPWGVRRFFVRDPQGVVVSVLAHA